MADAEVMRFLFLVCGVTVLAVLAANLGLHGLDPQGAFAKWGMGGVLVEMIGLFVWLVKKRQPTIRIHLVLAEQVEALDPSKLSWGRPCVLSLRVGQEGKQDVTSNVVLVRSPVGTSFQVQVPSTVVSRMTEHATMSLDLTDDKGIRWRVEAFNPFDKTVELRIPDEERPKFLEAYLDQEQ